MDELLESDLGRRTRTFVADRGAGQRMLKKLRGNLTDDIAPLLSVGVRFDIAVATFNLLWREPITRIGGWSVEVARTGNN